MATAAQDHATAFAAAEAALTQVEQQLAMSPPDREKLLSTCTGSGCFNKTCNEGLCFQGTYINVDSEFDCKVSDPTGKIAAIDFGAMQRSIFGRPPRAIKKSKLSA